MSNPDPVNRYRARVDELESIRAELEADKLRSDLGPVVGRVLEAAGDLIRRSTRIQTDLAALDRILMLVPNAGLTSWGEAVSVDDLAKRVARAAEEAVEAALPDTPEDGSTWNSWAMQGLFARDRLESALCSLERLGKLGRQDASTIHSKIRKQVDAADDRLKHRARWLSGLNGDRRSEAQLLDDSCRTKAWWFAAHCSPGDDELVKHLGEGGPLTGAEAAVHREVTKKRTRQIGFDELFRYDLGLASPAETAMIEAQAKKDPELRKAIAAMRDAEAAIEDNDPNRPQNPVSAGQAPAPGDRGSVQVIEDRQDFKVLVFRRSQRIRLVVQPVRTDRFAAAAVFLPDAPNTARPSRDTAEGLEFDLGPEHLLAGQLARVVVRLQGGAEIKVEARL